MKKAMLIMRDEQLGWGWCEWRIVWVIKEYKNAFKIWSWKDLFGRWIPKKSMGYRIELLGESL